VAIVGVSFDPPEENQTWAQEQGYLYELWTDEGRELALYYGAATTPTQGAASRVTQLLDASGTLILEYAGVSVGAHPGEVLQDCQALFP
jgi:peroxiredoxin Q/BCP